MRRIKLYIASSLDNKIAAPDGNVNWLNEFDNVDHDYGYYDFIKTIDTTFMGFNTYSHILSMGVEFPYKDKTNYVFTRNKNREKAKYVNLISGNPLEFIKELKGKDGKDIWLVGGGELNTFLLENQLIDEMILFVMPVILGEGINLFNETGSKTNLKLQSEEAYDNDVVKLIYNYK